MKSFTICFLFLTGALALKAEPVRLNQDFASGYTDNSQSSSQEAFCRRIGATSVIEEIKKTHRLRQELDQYLKSEHPEHYQEEIHLLVEELKWLSQRAALTGEAFGSKEVHLMKYMWQLPLNFLTEEGHTTELTISKILYLNEENDELRKYISVESNRSGPSFHRFILIKKVTLLEGCQFLETLKIHVKVLIQKKTNNRTQSEYKEFVLGINPIGVR